MAAETFFESAIVSLRCHVGLLSKKLSLRVPQIYVRHAGRQEPDAEPETTSFAALSKHPQAFARRNLASRGADALNMPSPQSRSMGPLNARGCCTNATYDAHAWRSSSDSLHACVTQWNTPRDRPDCIQGGEQGGGLSRQECLRDRAVEDAEGTREKGGGVEDTRVVPQGAMAADGHATPRDALTYDFTPIAHAPSPLSYVHFRVRIDYDANHLFHFSIER